MFILMLVQILFVFLPIVEILVLNLIFIKNSKGGRPWKN